MRSRPEPYSVGSPSGRAQAVGRPLISVLLRLGLYDLIKVAPSVTCGVAIDVPLQGPISDPFPPQ